MKKWTPEQAEDVLKSNPQATIGRSLVARFMAERAAGMGKEDLAGRDDGWLGRTIGDYMKGIPKNAADGISVAEALALLRTIEVGARAAELKA